MKKLNTSQSLLISVIIFSVALLLGALFISQTNFTIRQIGASLDGSTPSNSISVAASGEAFLKPDTLTMRIGVSEKAATTKKAIEAANTKINEVRALVLKSGVAEKDVQTSSLSLYPDYDYNNGTQVLIGQQASQTLTVKMRDIGEDAAKAASLIDNVATINNITLNSINFSAEDDAAAVTAARQEAMDKAKAKAEELAAAAGVSVLAPISITESTDSYSTPTYYARSYAEAAVFDDAGDTEISTGELGVSVNVSVLYAIE